MMWKSWTDNFDKPHLTVLFEIALCGVYNCNSLMIFKVVVESMAQCSSRASVVQSKYLLHTYLLLLCICTSAALYKTKEFKNSMPVVRPSSARFYCTADVM